MSTLLDLKTEAAGLLSLADTSAFTVNTQDLFLRAANTAKRKAEMQYDLEFTRKLVKVTVNSATGGDLSSAEDADGNAVRVKSIIEAGFLDDAGNLAPVEWTTVAEGIERQRQTTGRYPSGRYGGPGDAVIVDRPLSQSFCGQGRFQFSGKKVYSFPKSTTPEQDYELWLEVYSFTPDWENQGDESNEVWLSEGYDYILWESIVKLNYRWKKFVGRTEGNLPPPTDQAQAALTSFLEWDTAQYEQFRRHSR